MFLGRNTKRNERKSKKETNHKSSTTSLFCETLLRKIKKGYFQNYMRHLSCKMKILKNS